MIRNASLLTLTGIACLLCMTAPPAAAAMKDPPLTPAAAGLRLADPVVDGTFGFSIRPPKDWQVMRQRVPEKRGVTLLRMARMAAPGQFEEMMLRQTTTTKPVPMPEMLDRITEKLELERSGVRVDSQQEQGIAGRKGGIITATYVSDRQRKLRLEAIIEVRPREYFVLLYEGPESLRSAGEPLFHLVLGSLEILSLGLDESALEAAMDNGKALLADVSADVLSKCIIPEQYLLIEVDGAVVGYAAVFTSEKMRDQRPGIEVRERGWTFESDGRARRLQSNMWMGLDLRHEHWKTSVTTLVPARPPREAYLEIALEEGLRAENVLLSNQVYSPTAPVTENPPLDLPPTYIPRVLIRMLPPLLVSDASHTQGAGQRAQGAVTTATPGLRLAFVTFDHARAGLIARVMEFKGAVPPPAQLATTKVATDKFYRFDDREGLAALPSSIYVDDHGRTLLVEAGPLTMRAATPGEIEKRFIDRVSEAEQSMNRLEAAYTESEQRVRRRNR